MQTGHIMPIKSQRSRIALARALIITSKELFSTGIPSCIDRLKIPCIDRAKVVLVASTLTTSAFGTKQANCISAGSS